MKEKQPLRLFRVTCDWDNEYDGRIFKSTNAFFVIEKINKKFEYNEEEWQIEEVDKKTYSHLDLKEN